MIWGHEEHDCLETKGTKQLRTLGSRRPFRSSGWCSAIHLIAAMRAFCAAERARRFRGDDEEGYRSEFTKLAERAADLRASEAPRQSRR